MTQLEALQGDITTLNVDAIVNAANSSLMGGGGVDGAIHRAGGPAILEECRAIVAGQGGCEPGQAVITTGGRLPARYVIHTVGPVWQGGGQNERHILSKCYYCSLKLAHEHGVRSIAFPCISTGVYGYPQAKAAETALATVQSYLDEFPNHFDRIVFCCFNAVDLALYNQMLAAEEPAG